MPWDRNWDSGSFWGVFQVFKSLGEPCLTSRIQSCLTLCNPTDYSPLGYPIHGIFQGKEDWSVWPFPTPGNFPDPGIEPTSPTSPASAGGFFTTELHGKPILTSQRHVNKKTYPNKSQGSIISTHSLWRNSVSKTIFNLIKSKESQKGLLSFLFIN